MASDLFSSERFLRRSRNESSSSLGDERALAWPTERVRVRVRLDDAGRRFERWWSEWTDQTEVMGRPRVAPSLPAMGRLMADEALLRAQRRHRTNDRPLGRAELIGAESEIASATELYERSGWLSDPMSFHRSPPPARPEQHELPWPFGAASELRFASDYAPEPEDPSRARWLAKKANRQAHAWQVRESGDPSRWLICVPGLGMGNAYGALSSFEAMALQRRHGVNVLVYVPPLHGPRRERSFDGDGAFAPFPLSYVHFISQAVWDLRRLLAWVRSEGAEHVGLYGLGHGAVPAALLGNIDPDLECVIAGVPEIAPMRHAQGYCEAVAEQNGENIELVRTRLERLYGLVSPLTTAPTTPTTPTTPRPRRYVFAGLVDRFASPEDAQRLVAHWEHAETVWYPGGHVSFAGDQDVQNLLMRAFWQSGLIDRQRFEDARTLNRWITR